MRVAKTNLAMSEALTGWKESLELRFPNLVKGSKTDAAGVDLRCYSH